MSREQGAVKQGSPLEANSARRGGRGGVDHIYHNMMGCSRRYEHEAESHQTLPAGQQLCPKKARTHFEMGGVRCIAPAIRSEESTTNKRLRGLA